MPVHGIGVGGFLCSVFRRQMNHQLMAEEVEVDPVCAGTTFLQPENFAVKVPCGGRS
jgi:predicted amino acid dehydrogenase